MSKTNAIRILEAGHVKHTFHEYPYNENELDAVTVAAAIGAEPEQVFKTLVTRGDKNGFNVFCIPANSQLDLKKAAKASGNKSIEMIKQKELLPLTGYIHGGCSPIGMKKQFATFIDEIAQLFDEIYVSAGQRGMQVKIEPDNILKITGGKYADLQV
jgi:Cys-tRNA(Pro)/Cys-tRNA(Cys) deacylase